MSGGHFDYQQYRIGGIADAIQELIDSNDDQTVDEWNCTVGHGYNDITIQQFRKAVDTLRRAQVYAHRIDWLVSGDDGEESFHERLAKDLADAETEREPAEKKEYPREVQQLISRLVKLTGDKDPSIADVAFDLLRRWDQDRSTDNTLGLSEEDRQGLYEE